MNDINKKTDLATHISHHYVLIESEISKKSHVFEKLLEWN